MFHRPTAGQVGSACWQTLQNRAPFFSRHLSASFWLKQSLSQRADSRHSGTEMRRNRCKFINLTKEMLVYQEFHRSTAEQLVGSASWRALWYSASSESVKIKTSLWVSVSAMISLLIAQRAWDFLYNQTEHTTNTLYLFSKRHPLVSIHLTVDSVHTDVFPA